MEYGSHDAISVNQLSLGKRWSFLGLATVAQVSVAMIRLGITTLIPFIKQDLLLNYVQVGLMSSFMNGGAGAAGIPAGRLVDRVGARLVLGYGTIGCGVLVLAIYGVNSYTAILILLCLIGFASTTLVPAGGKVVATWFSRNERGTAMGVRQTAVPLGGAVAALVLPWLAVETDWRFALSLTAITSIGIGLLAFRFYHEPQVDGAGSPLDAPAPVASIFKRRGVPPLMLYCCFLSAGQWTFLAYLMLFLTESLHLSIIIAANLFAVAQICGALGRVIWGVVSDRVFHSKRRPALALVGLTAATTSAICVLLSAKTPLWLVASIMALLGFSLQGWNGLTHALAAELAGTEMAGLAVGLTNSCGFVGVIALTPTIGFLIDRVGTYAAGWMSVSLLVCFALLMLVYINEENGSAYDRLEKAAAEGT